MTWHCKCASFSLIECIALKNNTPSANINCDQTTVMSEKCRRRIRLQTFFLFTFISFIFFLFLRYNCSDEKWIELKKKKIVCVKKLEHTWWCEKILISYEDFILYLKDKAWCGKYVSEKKTTAIKLLSRTILKLRQGVNESAQHNVWVYI